MKRKILFYYVILILIGITITGFFTSQLTQKFYKYEVEERLKSTAKLIHYQISNDILEGREIDYNRLAKTYAEILNRPSKANTTGERINARVTFVDFDGVVIGESETDYKHMENHGNRKEIKEAIAGKIGKDIRLSKTLQIDFFYIAIPLEQSRIVIRVSVPLVQLKIIDRIIWYYTIIGILGGLSLTSLLALKFSSSITSPIKQLISVSKEISYGNYSQRVKVNSKDELGQLGETFNKMAEELEKTVVDLTDKNIKMNSIVNSMTEGIVAVDTNNKVILINSIACKLFGISNKSKAIGTNILEVIRNNQINSLLQETIRDNVSKVDEIYIGPPEEKYLRIYTNPIKPSNSSARNTGGIITVQDITNIKKLEQIRTEFVSNVTHELKTPLTSIRGFVETLRGGAINDKQVADKFLEIIDIEADRLYMLINDILQLSEIESMEEESNIATYKLKSILSDILPILQKAAEKKGVKIIDEVDESIEITANQNRIKQMLINLIDNAIKYNVENGSIFIKAFRTEGKVVIKVKDTGIGIPEEHLSRIFERFYRVDKGRSRSMGGTGLGLSIVKHIVNLYNGDIKVKSQPGYGTEFTIQLPS